MIKNGKKQNVVSTNRKQNMAAAKVCETHNEAIGLFRALQHANDMGTGEDDFDELAEHFINHANGPPPGTTRWRTAYWEADFDD